MGGSTCSWRRRMQPAGAYKKVLGDRAREHTRYAIKKEGDCFDPGRLRALVETLPAGITLSRIHGELYGKCLKEEWSRDPGFLLSLL